MASACRDPRLPALVGPWVVGCDDEGRVDRVRSIRTGQTLSLPRPLASPGWGAAPHTDTGYLVQPGVDGGLFRLDSDGITSLGRPPTLGRTLVAPPTTDGVHLGALEAARVQAFRLAERRRSLYDAAPLGDGPPALAWPWIAWTQAADVPEEGVDLWWLDAAAGSDPLPLATGPGDQRHVVASGQWLAWVDDGDVVLRSVSTGEERRLPARTGFQAPPSLWRDTVCWEERGPRDLDIRCSDGWTVAASGHQEWPSRWDDRLLYRQEGAVYLAGGP